MWCVGGVGGVTHYVRISHMYVEIYQMHKIRTPLCIRPCLFLSICMSHPSFPVSSLAKSCSVDKYCKAVAMINSDIVTLTVT